MSEPNGLQMPEGKSLYQFNGLNSNNSSRGASPAPRVGSIPASQLPPARGIIPASQLPPSRSAISGMTQKVNQLSVSGQSTPNISPNKFSTSTPNQAGHAATPVFSENASPVVPNSMESVPLNDNVKSDIANKNVTLKPNNSADNASVQLSQKTSIPSSMSGQYVSQSSSFNTHLNGQQNMNMVRQNLTPHHLEGNNQHFSQVDSQLTNSNPHNRSNVNMPQNKYFQNQDSVPLPFQSNIVPTNQSLTNLSNIGRATPPNIQSIPQNIHSIPQNYFPQQNSNIFPKAPLSSIPPNQSQQIKSIAGQNLPQNPQSNINEAQFTPLPPTSKISQPQILRPSSQPQFSSSSGENAGLQKPNNQDRTIQGNPLGAQNALPVSHPPQSQNMPNFPSSLPQNVPNLAPFQNNTPQSQPSQFSQPLRPRYPQTLPQNPPFQNVPQGFPVRPQFNTGLPTKTTTYPPAQANLPPSTQQTTVPSQNFNPQINYNSIVPGSTAIHQPNPAPYGAPPNMNSPSLPPPIQGQIRPGISSNRYPVTVQQQVAPQPQGFPNQQNQFPTSGVVPSGFNRLWGRESHDLLQMPNILPATKIQPPEVHLGQEALDQANCNAEVFRCTVTKIPETSSLLQKTRLPLGLLIHPFKDLSYLPVIQCNVIVRCRACRTYINPYVYFVDSKRWKCNLCFRINELPEEFQYDPVSKTYGDPSRRPEIKSSTIEYIAPAEYMLRPPQPAVYLYLLDVSRLAIESGYLEVFCTILLQELKNIPGDARTQIGFLAYDSALHFFSLADGLNQPQEMTVVDIDDVFLPTPDNLLVNLKDRTEMVEDLLNLLPKRFGNSFDGNSALGAALQVAHKMMGATGGRVTVFQAALPNVGPGAVTAREDPNQRSTAETPLLNPVNDFYKRLALECSGQQIAVDLFVVNSQYVDMATISGISRFSGGCIHHFPLFKTSRPQLVDSFQKSLRRYLTRKIGFEAVMRVRCTRGLAIHTFHGNFFVRSTDLLSLPNINPEAAFGMQVAIEESLSDSQTVCFQAALLYTSSKGERRIRVHTLCLPTASTIHDVVQSVDQQCIIGLLGKMAVDRSMQSSLSDAREAFINAAIDVLSAYKVSLNQAGGASGLLAPDCLKLLPLYISAILKHPAFRIGIPTRLDDRVKAMIDLKTKPLYLLMQQVYPDMYPIHNLENVDVVLNSEEEPVPLPPRLQLSARCLENKGAFLLDCGEQMLILVGPNISKEFLNDALGVSDYGAIPDDMIEIPILDNMTNQRLHQFINYLNDEKPYPVPLQVIRDNNPNRMVFLEKLVEDRLENSLSYHEFLQHLKTQVK